MFFLFSIEVYIKQESEDQVFLTKLEDENNSTELVETSIIEASDIEQSIDMKLNHYDSFVSHQKWSPPSLSELTSTLFTMELTHL